MNARPTLERRVTDWLQAEAPARAPERVLATTLDRVAVIGQERTLTQLRYRNRTGTSRAVLIAATAALIAILVAGAVFVGSLRRTEDAPPPPPPAPAARTLGQGPMLQWTRVDVIPPPGTGPEQGTTRVAWIGGRFVLVDEDSETVAVSADGSTWTTVGEGEPDRDHLGVMASEDPIASWGNDVVSWSPTTPGSGVRIRLSSDATFVAPFDGTVDAVGIGPAGIIVSSHIEFDQFAFIESVLGPTWSSNDIGSMGLQEGILQLGSFDGRTASIDLADHGVDQAQFENWGGGWHSVDGKQWTPIPEFPAQVSSIVGIRRRLRGVGRNEYGRPDVPFPGWLCLAADGDRDRRI